MTTTNENNPAHLLAAHRRRDLAIAFDRCTFRGGARRLVPCPGCSGDHRPEWAAADAAFLAALGVAPGSDAVDDAATVEVAS